MVLSIWLHSINVSTVIATHTINDDDDEDLERIVFSSSESSESITNNTPMDSEDAISKIKIPQKMKRLIPKVPPIWPFPQISAFLRKHRKGVCSTKNSGPCFMLTHQPHLLGICIAIVTTLCFNGQLKDVYDCTLDCLNTITIHPHNFGKTTCNKKKKIPHILLLI